MKIRGEHRTHPDTFSNGDNGFVGGILSFDNFIVDLAFEGFNTESERALAGQNSVTLSTNSGSIMDISSGIG